MWGGRREPMETWGMGCGCKRVQSEGYERMKVQGGGVRHMVVWGGEERCMTMREGEDRRMLGEECR